MTDRMAELDALRAAPWARPEVLRRLPGGRETRVQGRKRHSALHRRFES